MEGKNNYADNLLKSVLIFYIKRSACTEKGNRANDSLE